MSVARLEGCLAGFEAHVGRRLIYPEAKARDFDAGIREGQDVAYGELF